MLFLMRCFSVFLMHLHEIADAKFERKKSYYYINYNMSALFN